MATTESELQTNLDNVNFGDKVNEVSENVRKVIQNLLPQILKGVNLNGKKSFILLNKLPNDE